MSAYGQIYANDNGQKGIVKSVGAQNHQKRHGQQCHEPVKVWSDGSGKHGDDSVCHGINHAGFLDFFVLILDIRKVDDQSRNIGNCQVVQKPSG